MHYHKCKHDHEKDWHCHHNHQEHRQWNKKDRCDHDDICDKHEHSHCGCYKPKEHNRCVCKTVKEINEAQHEVTDKNQDCNVNCEKAIEKLLHKSHNGGLDTIPFKLISGCKGDGDPFVGTGVIKIHGCFYDIRSSYFRVVDFVKGSSCCAILELLCPVRCKNHKHGIKGFVKTGACLEVDLNDFTGITCFPPVKAEKMDPKKLLCGDWK